MKEQKKKNHTTDNTDIPMDTFEETEKSETDFGSETPAAESNEPLISEEAQLKTQLAEANDKYLRLYAEFDNYKRRTAKERLDMLQSAGKEVIFNLLTILDDFERALKAMEAADNADAIKEGIRLVYQKLHKILLQKGLKEMVSIGETFDVDLHEAITNIPAPSEDLKGKIIDEVEKGYYLHDKVLRYAKVVVGN